MAEVKKEETILKLDLGCGSNKNQGFLGVDSINFPGVDQVVNLTAREKPKKGQDKGDFKSWPWETGTVEEVHCSHFVEHLEPDERIHFCNELYRILKPAVYNEQKQVSVPGGKATVIAPHWCSMRAYGDMTHKWPPVSEFWFYYLSSDWRKVNSPHVDEKDNKGGYNCNFSCSWGYSLNPSIVSFNSERQNFALANFKESASDIISTWVKL